MEKFCLKIEEIEFAGGAAFHPGALNVLVGPNNSGKTTVLRDIDKILARQKESLSAGRLVTNLRHSSPTGSKLSPGGRYTIEKKSDCKIRSGLSPRLDEMLQTRSSSYYGTDFNEHVAPFLFAFLRTEDRLALAMPTRPKTFGPQGGLAEALFKLPTVAESRFRAAFQSMDTGLDIVLDFAHGAPYQFRVSPSSIDLPADPREARPLLAKLELLSEQGDGIRSIAGLLLAIETCDRDVLLIDEPEAFLHPPQAFAMGAYLARQASQRRQIFVATHSADILRGILSQSVSPSVLRMTGDRSSCHVASPEVIEQIARDEHLSANRCLDGLFYPAIVVVESDGDALFYQRVANRLRLPDTIHWLRAHNKQTIRRIASPYRNLRMTVGAVVDIDILRESSDFEQIIRSLTSNDPGNVLDLRRRLVQSFEERTSAEKLTSIKVAIDALVAEFHKYERDPKSGVAAVQRRLRDIQASHETWERLKQYGREALPGEARVMFDELHAWCHDNNLFIVPVGELESWLADEGVSHPQGKHSRKQGWLPKALATLENANSPSGGVWDFVASIYAHVLPVRDRRTLALAIVPSESAPPAVPSDPKESRRGGIISRLWRRLRKRRESASPVERVKGDIDD